MCSKCAHDFWYSLHISQKNVNGLLVARNKISYFMKLQLYVQNWFVELLSRYLVICMWNRIGIFWLFHVIFSDVYQEYLCYSFIVCSCFDIEMSVSFFQCMKLCCWQHKVSHLVYHQTKCGQDKDKHRFKAIHHMIKSAGKELVILFFICIIFWGGGVEETDRQDIWLDMVLWYCRIWHCDAL